MEALATVQADRQVSTGDHPQALALGALIGVVVPILFWLTVAFGVSQTFGLTLTAWFYVPAALLMLCILGPVWASLARHSER